MRVPRSDHIYFLCVIEVDWCSSAHQDPVSQHLDRGLSIIFFQLAFDALPHMCRMRGNRHKKNCSRCGKTFNKNELASHRGACPWTRCRYCGRRKLLGNHIHVYQAQLPNCSVPAVEGILSLEKFQAIKKHANGKSAITVSNIRH